MTILLFVVGLLFLIAEAEALVKGAFRLAAAFGISQLIVGLIIVAWGTSSPELIVSINVAFSVRAGIAIGNVVWSNIFNVQNLNNSHFQLIFPIRQQNGAHSNQDWLKGTENVNRICCLL